MGLRMTPEVDKRFNDRSDIKSAEKCFSLSAQRTDNVVTDL